MNSLETTSVSVAADDRLSMAVVDLVARVDDTDPLELDPLYHAIDPDLLDSLSDETGFTGLEFSYHGYTVTVTGGDEGLEVALEGAGVSADESTGDLVDSST